MKTVDANANRLILMRHAKSEWFSGVDSDFLRPLTTRGGSDARRMGKWLAEQGFTPTSVLSSPARRTRETVSQIGLGMGKALESCTEWADPLYHSTIEVLLDGLVGHAKASGVMIVGHNPGMEDFLHWLVPARQIPRDYKKLFPTSAVYVLDCRARLTELSRGCATVVAHQRPKQLDDD